MSGGAKFFHFSQNNSGGSFAYDEAAGITAHVIIEAASSDDANRRAEEAGIYFDGCDAGIDCDCCGDRWHPAWGAGDDTPKVYGSDIRAEGGYRTSFSAWMDEGREVCIHPIDGPLEWYGVIKEGRTNA